MPPPAQLTAVSKKIRQEIVFADAIHRRHYTHTDSTPKTIHSNAIQNNKIIRLLEKKSSNIINILLVHIYKIDTGLLD